MSKEIETELASQKAAFGRLRASMGDAAIESALRNGRVSEEQIAIMMRDGQQQH